MVNWVAEFGIELKKWSEKTQKFEVSRMHDRTRIANVLTKTVEVLDKLDSEEHLNNFIEFCRCHLENAIAFRKEKIKLHQEAVERMEAALGNYDNMATMFSNFIKENFEYTEVMKHSPHLAAIATLILGTLGVDPEYITIGKTEEFEQFLRQLDQTTMFKKREQEEKDTFVVEPRKKLRRD